MKKLLLLGLCPLLGNAADTIRPLDVKLGLWESTTTSEMTGMPPIPDELLAKMTPEQRSRMEAAAKARGAQSKKAPSVHQSCVTKESLAKAQNFGNDDRLSCQRNIIRSSSTAQDIRFECDVSGIKSTGNIHVEAVNPEHVKGTSQVEAAGGKNAMTMKVNFESRWIGPDCSAMKK